jgi:hypothetical protein
MSLETGASLKEVVDKAEQIDADLQTKKQLIATAVTGKDVPTNGSDSFQKMADNIDSIRNKLANTITSKGIEANGVDSFDDLRDKVEQIEVEKHTNIPDLISDIHDTWIPVVQDKPDIPQLRMTNYICTFINENLYFLGGGETSSKIFSVINMKSGKITELPQIPINISKDTSKTVGIDGKIFFINSGMYSFDIKSNTWTQYSSLKDEYKNGCIGLDYEDTNCFYLTKSASLYKYNLLTNTWTLLSNNCSNSVNSFYIEGKKMYSYYAKLQFSSFNIETNEKNEAVFNDETIFNREGQGGFVLNEKAYYNATYNVGNILTQAGSYDFNTNQYSLKSPLTKTGGVYVQKNGNVFCIGGSSGYTEGRPPSSGMNMLAFIYCFIS